MKRKNPTIASKRSAIIASKRGVPERCLKPCIVVRQCGLPQRHVNGLWKISRKKNEGQDQNKNRTRIRIRVRITIRIKRRIGRRIAIRIKIKI